MQKVTKHYVEAVYPMFDIDSLQKTDMYEVEKRSLELVKHSSIISYFRFFDATETTLDNGKKIISERKNFSSEIYFGERTCVIHMGEYEDAIKCYNGTIHVHPVGCITADEYELQEKNKNEKLDNGPRKILKVHPHIVKKNRDRINK